MLGRRNREFPSHKTEPAGFAARATDLDALRAAVVDAAGVGYGLWFSYLFALLYFAIAAGAVTHRDLLLESPVKLPFLNVELPFRAFFVLAPLVFLIVHAYVLLHLLLLAGKVGAFHAELRRQVKGDDTRTRLRRQLPSNIFVQILSGPREVRTGIVGFLTKSVAWVSLIAGPIALLVLFQLQFLPHHNLWITWWQRIAVVLDLILLWILWPPIAHGETALLAWYDLGRVKVAAWALVTLAPALFVFAVATFPGEWLEEALPSVSVVPTKWPTWKTQSAQTDQASEEHRLGSRPGQKQTEAGKPSLRVKLVDALKSMEWTSPHDLLLAGKIDLLTEKPNSLWSNVLFLPGFEIGGAAKSSVSPGNISLRGRHLEGAVLRGSDLRKADFSNAQLADANFFAAQLQGASLAEAHLERARLDFAHLQGASFLRAHLQRASLQAAHLQGADLVGAHLQGARLDFADLQGADLYGAQLQGASLALAGLQGASLNSAHLQGASLLQARLQGASLDFSELQGALLFEARLQSASLNEAQLQGPSWLDYARLEGASLSRVFVWRAKPPAIQNVKGALIEAPETGPKYRGLDCTIVNASCDWSDQSYAALKSQIENGAPAGSLRDDALKRIEPLGEPPYTQDRALAEAWGDLEKSPPWLRVYYQGLAEQLKQIGCAPGEAPYVIRGLIRQLDVRFSDSPAQEAEVAAAFLNEASCPGARGLSEENKTRLIEIRDRAKPSPSSGTASQSQ